MFACLIMIRSVWKRERGSSRRGDNERAAREAVEGDLILRERPVKRAVLHCGAVLASPETVIYDHAPDALSASGEGYGERRLPS